MRIGPYWLHRLEQYDLDCWPILCIHKTLDHGNETRRVFCLYVKNHRLRVCRHGK